MRKLFVVFILWAVLLTSCTVEETSQAPTAVLPSRTMASSTMDMTEIWRVRTGLPNPSPDVQTPPFLYIAGDKIVMSTFIEDGSYDSFLTAFSLTTGGIVWQTRYKDPDSGTNIGKAYLDKISNRLYLVYSYRVSAFDLETGRQLWITENLRTHVGYVFPYEQTDASKIQVDNPQDHITIDSSTGKILTVQPSTWSGVDNLKVLYHDLLIKNLSDEEVDKFNFDQKSYHFGALDVSGQFLWDIPQHAEFWPTFINENDFIVAFGGPTYQIWRVNAQTGLDRWRSDLGIVSNYAILQDRVIALREDGYLLSMDLESGRLFNYAVFDMNFRESIGERPFWVAASDPYLFVYFGDTQELVAFRMNTP